MRRTSGYVTRAPRWVVSIVLPFPEPELIFAKREHRLDTACAQGRDEASDERDHGKDERGRKEHTELQGAHSEKKRVEKTG